MSAGIHDHSADRKQVSLRGTFIGLQCRNDDDGSIDGNANGTDHSDNCLNAKGVGKDSQCEQGQAQGADAYKHSNRR